MRKRITTFLLSLTLCVGITACNFLPQTSGAGTSLSSSNLDIVEGSEEESTLSSRVESYEYNSEQDEDSSSEVEDSSSNDEGSSSSDEDSSSEDEDSSSSDEDSSSEDEDSSSSDEDSSSDSEDSSSGGEETEVADLSVHFLELGNEYAGDCTLIDIGDTEILIDAGSRKESAPTLKAYINKYCNDGTLEYVIATHAHQDHIAAFVGTGSGNNKTGILYQYDIGTLIQFSKTNSTTQIYNNYKSAVTYAKSQGTKVHTVLECWNNTNGAKRSYQVGEGITMNFLYQNYYATSTSDENDYSVCMLLKQGENNFLFTGDLESAGEASLVANNTLPKCKLYKGGHHGSKTSSTAALLAKIQPEIVCVCCCAGTNEYTETQANQFPTQAFINRIALYTDKVYVTSAKAGYTLNGNITVSCTGSGMVTVTGSNNNLILKETAWFKAERTLPEKWR